jgi:hypothetical protein
MVAERIPSPEDQWRDFKRLWFLKLITFLWFVSILVISLYGIAATWNEWWPIPDLNIVDLARVKPALYASLAGIVGATVYALRGFYHAVGPSQPKRPDYQYDPNWTWWYLSRPVLGGFLGFASFTILRAGVGTLGSAQADGTALTGYLSVGLLSGFSASSVFDWMSAIAERLFGSADQHTGG